MNSHQEGYWSEVWNQLRRHRLGNAALYVFFLFVFVGVYAPFFASSKPMIVEYNGTWFFPLFRYLFYTEFYTKRLDIFFNILMFTLPAFIIVFKWFMDSRLRWILLFAIVCLQFIAFLYFGYKTPSDPAADIKLIEARQQAIKKTTAEKGYFLPTWDFDLAFMNPYAKLNLVLREILRKRQNEKLAPYRDAFEKVNHQPMPTLWNLERANDERELEVQKQFLTANAGHPGFP